MITREQSRNADQFAIKRLGIPGIVLMENAGRSCAEKLLAFRKSEFSEVGNFHPSRNFGVIVCCGGGNNGGDGFVIARHLHNAHCPVKVLLCRPPEQYQGDAAINLRIIERMPIQVVQFDPDWHDEQIAFHLTTVNRSKASWIVDAILGTGATGELRPQIRRLVESINSAVIPTADEGDGVHRHRIHRMAIDIPTGLDCDTGSIDSVAVKADVTCTFIDRKIGFESAVAQSCLGHVSVIGIGAPAMSFDANNDE